MIVVIRRGVLLGAGLFGCFVLSLAAVLWAGHGTAAPALGPMDQGPRTVVVDAGHGGEDGGAVSPEGVVESGVNLEIALRLRDTLAFAGQRTRLTRATGEALHTEGTTIRERKRSDLRRRTEIVNETPGAVLVSIHQNSLPASPTTHGAYVFWNRQEGAEAVGTSIQDVLNRTVNAGNEKKARQVAGSVYLMDHVTAPGVLVECGFLSNAGEVQKLREPSYQTMLAGAVAVGVLLAGEDVS